MTRRRLSAWLGVLQVIVATHAFAQPQPCITVNPCPAVTVHEAWTGCALVRNCTIWNAPLCLNGGDSSDYRNAPPWNPQSSIDTSNDLGYCAGVGSAFSDLGIAGERDIAYFAFGFASATTVSQPNARRCNSASSRQNANVTLNVPCLVTVTSTADRSHPDGPTNYSGSSAQLSTAGTFAGRFLAWPSGPSVNSQQFQVILSPSEIARTETRLALPGGYSIGTESACVVNWAEQPPPGAPAEASVTGTNVVHFEPVFGLDPTIAVVRGCRGEPTTLTAVVNALPGWETAPLIQWEWSTSECKAIDEWYCAGQPLSLSDYTLCLLSGGPLTNPLFVQEVIPGGHSIRIGDNAQPIYVRAVLRYFCYTEISAAVVVLPYSQSPAECCDTLDFNGDGVYPDDRDVVDFLNQFAGGGCSNCSDIDFNNDGVFPDDRDLTSFFTVLAGGQCE
jgi:hypothetical protein